MLFEFHLISPYDCGNNPSGCSSWRKQLLLQLYIFINIKSYSKQSYARDNDKLIMSII